MAASPAAAAATPHYAVIDHAEGAAYLEDGWDGCTWAVSQPSSQVRRFDSHSEATAWATSVQPCSPTAHAAPERPVCAAFACNRRDGGIGVGACVSGPDVNWRGHRFFAREEESPVLAAEELHGRLQAVVLALEAM